MKKIFIFLLVVVFMVACSKDEEVQKGKEVQKEEQEIQNDEPEEQEIKEVENKSEIKNEDINKVNVKQEKENVYITFPGSMFAGQDINAVMNSAKESGVEEVTQNSDGSISYKMSKEQHVEMLDAYKGQIKFLVEEIRDNYDSISNITYDEDFSSFSVSVDKEVYEKNASDSIVVYTLGMSGTMYQMYKGGNYDEAKVKITIIDESANEIIEEAVYPEDINIEI